jgi:hypothetical protein
MGYLVNILTLLVLIIDILYHLFIIMLYLHQVSIVLCLTLIVLLKNIKGYFHWLIR